MKSRFCSTRIMVSPVLSRSRCKTSTISSMIEGWIPSVGSSRRTRRGLPQRQRAIAKQLLLAARERTAEAIEKRLEARKLLQHGCDRISLRAALLAATHTQIVVNREAGKNLAPLRNIAETQPRALIGFGRGHIVTVQAHEPACRRQETHQCLEQRRLAHAIVTEDSNELALVDRKTNPVEDRNAAIARTQPLHIEHHAAACLPR